MTNVARSTNFSLQQLLPAFSAGLVIAVIGIFVEVSFAAMLFSGELGQFVGLGIGLCLAGSFLHCLLAVLTSSSQNTISVVQDAPIAIMAIVIASLATQMSASTPEEKLATALAVIVFSSALAGIFFWVLGHFNLGRLVRFIPYPVVGGFLAGTGFLLVTGGIGVMADAPFNAALRQTDQLVRWLPGLLYAAALLLLLQRYSQFWVMPSLLLAGILLFYAIYLLLGGTMASAAADGWLLGPFPSGRLWQPVIGSALMQADWLLVLSNGVKLSTVLLVSAISLLFNVSGLELISGEEVDLNRELRWAGLANLAGVLVVSPAGFTTLSFSVLGYRLGGRTRAVGLFATLIIGLAVLFGAAALSSFPRMIAGGLLTFLGLSFLKEWVVDTWKKLPRLDYLLIWVILIVIATVGFLEGVAVGILIAALLFLVNYSQVDVIRRAASRAEYTSPTVRPLLYEQLLTQRGERLSIVTLQGYLFFGTAHRLVEQITTRMADADRPPLRFLVLDFALVTGIDSSATFSFARLKQSTEAENVQVVLTGLQPALQSQLMAELWDESGGSENGVAPMWRVMPTVAEGVAWCEEQMIRAFTDVGLVDAPKSMLDHMRKHLSSTEEAVNWLDYLKPGAEPAPSAEFTTFLSYLDRIEFQAGDTLLAQDAPVDGFCFLEEGSACYQVLNADQQIVEAGTVEAGTVLGANAFYTDQPSPQTITGAGKGTLYRLSRVALQRMEAEQPQLAIALHRTLAAQLGQRAQKSREVAKALQH